MSDYESITECIACGGNGVMPFFSLGNQPLANSFKKTADAPEKKYPLGIQYCKACYHVQLTHKVNPDLLFKDYIYRSGTAKTQLDYFNWFVELVDEYTNFLDLGYNHIVLDIGCNDGSQLTAFRQSGWDRTYGVDPAQNIVPIASAAGHHVACGYFDGNEFGDIKFPVIVCQNAFAHNSNQLELLKNMMKVLSDDGLIFITTSQADMIINHEFDTIYHEHLSFYNIKSMDAICFRAGLNVIDVLRHPIHGGSYIFVLSRDRRRPLHIERLMAFEEECGIYDDDIYDTWQNDVDVSVNEYIFQMKRHKGQIPIVGYGSPAKGNTFMNYAGIGPDFIVDDSAPKQGTFTPGLGIPVYHPNKLLELADEAQVMFVPLAWNFMEEIVSKIGNYRKNNYDMFVEIMPYCQTYTNVWDHHGWARIAA